MVSDHGPVSQILVEFRCQRSHLAQTEGVKDLKISDSHLDQIEHLLAQSMNGIHLLFDNETIAKVLKTPTEHIDLFQVKNLDKIQELFTEFIKRETLQDKQLYLHSLDEKSFEMLLRTYFHIVDNSLMQAELDKH